MTREKDRNLSLRESFSENLPKLSKKLSKKLRQCQDADIQPFKFLVNFRKAIFVAFRGQPRQEPNHSDMLSSESSDPTFLPAELKTLTEGVMLSAKSS